MFLYALFSSYIYKNASDCGYNNSFLKSFEQYHDLHVHGSLLALALALGLALVPSTPQINLKGDLDLELSLIKAQGPSLHLNVKCN